MEEEQISKSIQGEKRQVISAFSIVGVGKAEFKPIRSDIELKIGEKKFSRQNQYEMANQAKRLSLHTRKKSTIESRKKAK